MKIILVILTLLATQISFAKDETPLEFVLCKNHDDVRTLSVLLNHKKDCVAHYSKKGNDEIIGQAKTPETCLDRVSHLAEILKSASFNCRSIAKVQVTTSSEIIK